MEERTLEALARITGDHFVLRNLIYRPIDEFLDMAPALTKVQSVAVFYSIFTARFSERCRHILHWANITPVKALEYRSPLFDAHNIASLFRSKVSPTRANEVAAKLTRARIRHTGDDICDLLDSKLTVQDIVPYKKRSMKERIHLAENKIPGQYESTFPKHCKTEIIIDLYGNNLTAQDALDVGSSDPATIIEAKKMDERVDICSSVPTLHQLHLKRVGSDLNKATCYHHALGANGKFPYYVHLKGATLGNVHKEITALKEKLRNLPFADQIIVNCLYRGIKASDIPHKTKRKELPVLFQDKTLSELTTNEIDYCVNEFNLTRFSAFTAHYLRKSIWEHKKKKKSSSKRKKLLLRIPREDHSKIYDYAFPVFVQLAQHRQVLLGEYANKYDVIQDLILEGMHQPVDCYLAGHGNGVAIYGVEHKETSECALSDERQFSIYDAGILASAKGCVRDLIISSCNAANEELVPVPVAKIMHDALQAERTWAAKDSICTSYIEVKQERLIPVYNKGLRSTVLYERK